MKPVASEADIDDLRRASQALAVMAAWSAGGLFRALADGRFRAPTELPGDPRAIALSAPLLAHVGLLTIAGDGESLALSSTGRRLLDQGAFPVGGAEGALGDLARFDPVLQLGGPGRGPDGSSRVTDGGVRPDNREATRAFLEMLHRRSAGSADEVARLLSGRWSAEGSATTRVLDLGGGHGRYARVLADLGHQATLFDIPLVVELARERHGDTLAYREGNFLTDDLGGPYDVVLLSNIVHGFDDQQNRALLARVRAALAPGGVAVIKDMFRDEHGAHPEEAVSFNMAMLLYTRGGRCYAMREIEAICNEAGLAPEEHVYVPDLRFSLLIARAPR